MLSLQKKVDVFSQTLAKKETSYADSFNANIEIAGVNYDYKFLTKLDSEQEILTWIAKLKSRLVLKEDENTIENIIDDFIICG